MTGPSWFWARVIRSATGRAAEQLVDAIERHRAKEHCPPQELHAAVASAGAWAETMVAYDFADNHGLGIDR